jgi:SAM-dependent methyltransferase
VAFENVYNVLQGAPLTVDVNWPPSTVEDTKILEEWMSRTAASTISILNKNVAFNEVKAILDVGGGDGTIACALAQKHSHLSLTVYNVPEAVKLANKKVSDQKLSDRIKVVEGNFLKDQSFPKGFDLILFSRVLCDWPEEVCEKLIKMAYESLSEGGYIVIAEPFKELNQNLMLVWEYRYMFWDNFGKATFKESTTYQKLLEKVGFGNFRFSVVDDNYIYRVLKARK